MPLPRQSSETIIPGHIAAFLGKYPTQEDRRQAAQLLVPVNGKIPLELDQPSFMPLVAQWGDNPEMGGELYRTASYMHSVLLSARPYTGQRIISFTIGTAEEVMNRSGDVPRIFNFDIGILAQASLRHDPRSTPRRNLEKGVKGNFLDYVSNLLAAKVRRVAVTGETIQVTPRSEGRKLTGMAAYSGTVLLDKNVDIYMATLKRRRHGLVLGNEAVYRILDELGITPQQLEATGTVAS